MLGGRTIAACMRMPLAVLLVGFAAAPAGARGDAGERDGADERDALLGPALVVDGEAVPDALVLRELVLGPGRAVLERAIDGWTIESELLQRAHARARTAVGDPDAEGFDAAFAEALAAERAAVEPSREQLEDAYVVAVQALGVETQDELATAVLWRYGGEAELHQDLVNELRFDATFLPEDPGAWPEITLAAFAATPETTRQLEVARRGWEASERARKHGLSGSGTRSQRAGHRDVVRAALRPWLGLAIAPDADGATAATADLDGDGTPDFVAATRELWPAVRAHVAPWDAALAKRWLATERLVRARLVDEGATVGPAPDPAAPRAASRALDGLSPEARAVHRALREAFVELHGARALADEELTARARRSAGTARVHVELMHFPAVDIARRALIDGDADGAWATARARATEVLARLKAVENAWLAREPYEGKPANPGNLWRAELTANGDLEASELGSVQADVPPHMPRGVLGAHTHAQLVQALGEDGLWRFVHDDSLADRIFEIEPGRFGGPWDGPFGVELVRGTAFQETRQPPSDTALRAWVLDRAFERYAREARAAAEILGLD